MQTKPAMLVFHSILESLKIDCANCCGLCCVALYFSRSDGFPSEKASGVPCGNLKEDFRCSIHTNLAQRNLKGCMAYDCFGAGQKVNRALYPGVDWKNTPDSATQMFSVLALETLLSTDLEPY